MQKECRTCGKIYEDAALQFCMQCGALLETLASDETRPLRQANETVRDTAPFPTNDAFNNYAEKPFGQNIPSNFGQPNEWTPPPAPIASWQNQNIGQNTPFMSPGIQGQNQTLAVVALCLGIGSITIGWCCSIGLVLSPAALITGFIALSQIKKNPQMNTGRELALAGIITGGIYLAVVVAFVLFYVIMIIIALLAK